MNRPRLLDLFCGAGGAAMGYHRAGFDVTGVDNRPQPHYPFEFVQADAMTYPLDGFDAIHASPPCQDYSKVTRHFTSGYARLIDGTRARLAATGLPWVIENVTGAPLPAQDTLDGAHGVELCGTMFGLPIWRHRLFECAIPVAVPRGCDHSVVPVNPYNAATRERLGIRYGRDRAFAQAMGIDWMTRPGLMEAVPPAYTEHIGHQLIDALTATEVAS